MAKWTKVVLAAVKAQQRKKMGQSTLAPGQTNKGMEFVSLFQELFKHILISLLQVTKHAQTDTSKLVNLEMGRNMAAKQATQVTPSKQATEVTPS